MQKLQLRASLLLATGQEKDEPVSSLECPPPCFESSKQYAEWVDLEGSAPTPPRKDFPAEPNYCRDCSPEGQAAMKKAGRCLFPLVRFQPMKNPDGEGELVGYTPKRFLPGQGHGSFGHAIHPRDDGRYLVRWFVLANGSVQEKIVDEAAAASFAEKWGVDFTPRAGAS
jgi:hypothetical protein